MHSRRASLSDLSSVEDIEGLTVRQLKEILARNFVNYQGCCEKWELMERVTRLFNDQKDLHNLGKSICVNTVLHSSYSAALTVVFFSLCPFALCFALYIGFTDSTRVTQ